MGTAVKHPVPDRVKPSFVIFDIWALWRSGFSVRVPGYQKLLDPVWYRMLYSYLPMATVGVEGLIALFSASHSRNIMADSHRNILKSHRRAEYKAQTTGVL